ncbi:DNA methyltransferase [Helicobacter pylori]|uniref:site-specific DNA-methyltransferase n=1 Tax=Helicobacter pylori TaxID=210 RepID=UPI0006831518|nr:site-specific DNA-methyltransferase [Helicobacter pylori]KMZ47445.1 DNA methyltransferase [Helicobacter pylori]
MTDKNQAKKIGINTIQSQQENNPLFDMLLKNFPQTIKDGKVNLSAIKTLLGFNESVNDISGYELTWTGKGLANALYSEPCQKQLKLQESFTPQISANKHPNNAIIIGDNLDCLKLLKSAYSEKIKMIYIDPPYNTQSDEFIYPDNFRKDYQKILREVGLLETDENGKETESESLKFFKNIQGSRSHSGWLSFMLPRLKLARDLLKEDGVIFISIDDNECAQLKLLCDEIFGEDNFVCNFTWQKNFAPKNDNKYISESTDYILCYSKYKDCFNRNLLPRTDKHDLSYSNPDNDKRGKWTSGSILVTTFSKNAVYEIIAPNGKKHFPPEGRSWRYSKETFKDLLEDNRIWFGQDGNGVPRVKRFLSEMPDGIVPQNLLLYQEVGSSQSGNKDLKDIFQIQLFDFPKPLNLIKHFLQISTTPNSNDIILDFFAGSGTTAHAVMELNAEDKGNREFILVQIDEEIKEDKSAYDFCKNVLKSAKPVISDITIERVKRAASKIIQSSKDSDLNCGFKVYTLEDKAQITNDKEGMTLFNHSHLTPFDKALNLALQCGKTLNSSLEIIIKDKLYKCEDAYFCIVCDEETQEYLAKSGNERIFLDGYEEIDLEAFLNLNASFKERLSVVY